MGWSSPLFLLTFAAAMPAIISGGIAERARFYPQLLATALLVAIVCPFFEGITWNGNYGIQDWLAAGFDGFIGQLFKTVGRRRCRTASVKLPKKPAALRVFFKNRRRASRP